MSLVLQITFQSISADGTQLTFEDTTGNYNISTNPGGYGTPNPARNTLALFLSVTNNRFDESPTIVATPLTLQTYNPLTVSTWIATLVKEGWIEATIYGVPLYDETGATLYTVGEVLYDSNSSQLRQILTVSGSGPYVYTFTIIQPSQLGTAGISTQYSTVLNTYAIPALNNCFNVANDKWLLSNEDCDFMTWQKINAYIASIQYGFQSGSYSNAQIKVETAEGICNCLDNCSC